MVPRRRRGRLAGRALSHPYVLRGQKSFYRNPSFGFVRFLSFFLSFFLSGKVNFVLYERGIHGTLSSVVWVNPACPAPLSLPLRVAMRSPLATPVPLCPCTLIVLPKSCSCRWGPAVLVPSLLCFVSFLSFFLERSPPVPNDGASVGVVCSLERSPVPPK